MLRFRCIPLMLFALLPMVLCGPRAAAAPDPAWGAIDVEWDRWGVPHVFARHDAGALYGLGWATARDRGFQMHWSLRIIQGRLAEVAGDLPKLNRNKGGAVASDRLMRTFGFARAAQTVAANLDAPTRGLLEAYSRGVNDWFDAHPQDRSPMFAATGLTPEPWTPADCLLSAWHLGQFFATDGTRDLNAWHNLQGEGRGGMRPPDSAALAPDDAAAIIQRADVDPAWIERVDAFAREHGFAAGPAGEGDGPHFSHAWVVGGRRTTDGASVLVSDPQTPVANPSLFYEFHLHGETIDARGIGVPGSPGMLIGWNRNVAWGVTALGADQADLFRLKTDPAHPGQYQFDGEWLPIERRTETIQVKGGEPILLDVRLTRFGPIVNEFAYARPGDPLVALKRIPVCETDRETIQASFAMMRAENAAGFVRALAGWRFPSVNLVFGDRAGSIGYWTLAAIPLRPADAPNGGGAALDGSSSQGDWQGFIPVELLPHVIDPPQGVLFSGNHRAIASFYPLSFGAMTGALGDTTRSRRLRERLTALDRFTPEQVLEVHRDMVNPARRDIVRLGLHLQQSLGRPLQPNAETALAHLKPWLEAGAASDLRQPGAAIAQNISTFFRIMATPLAERWGGGESGLNKFLKAAIARIEADPKAPLDDVERAFVEGALGQALVAAREQYGDDPRAMAAAARGEVRHRTLGYYESLDGFPSLDPAHDLAVPALFCVDGGTIQSQAAQAYTQWVPLGNVDGARSLLPVGNSERPGSPLRTATLEAWAQGDLHPAPLSRDALAPYIVEREQLAPAP